MKIGFIGLGNVGSKLANNLIEEGKEDVHVLSTNSVWFGVTYKEDKPMAVAAINKSITNGVYPKNLWD